MRDEGGGMNKETNSFLTSSLIPHPSSLLSLDAFARFMLDSVRFGRSYPAVAVR
jgi:hypothetical protein